MTREVNKTLAHQTIEAMGEMVAILKTLEIEAMDANPHRCAFLMEGPIHMMKGLIRDLEKALCQDNLDNDE